MVAGPGSRDGPASRPARTYSVSVPPPAPLDEEVGRPTPWAADVASGAAAVLLVALVAVSASLAVRGAAGLRDTLQVLAGGLALVTAAAAVGVTVRRTHEVAGGATAAPRAAASPAGHDDLVHERLRVAGDLHGVVGHLLGLVDLHADVAAEAVGRDDDGARTALRHVRGATAAMRHELRATAALLGDRPATDPTGRGARGVLPAATGPAGLSALVEPVRSAGVQVTTRVDVPTGSIDATVDAAAYRIVQECVADVLRRATARHVLVRLAVADRRLRITVADDGARRSVVERSVAGEPDPAGCGPPQAVARAVLLGGTVQAGRSADGGFAVTAVLPARLAE